MISQMLTDDCVNEYSLANACIAFIREKGVSIGCTDTKPGCFYVTDTDMMWVTGVTASSTIEELVMFDFTKYLHSFDVEEGMEKRLLALEKRVSMKDGYRKVLSCMAASLIKETSPEQFRAKLDARQDILSVEGRCVIDLRTGIHRDRMADDFCTMQTGVNYCPASTNSWDFMEGMLFFIWIVSFQLQSPAVLTLFFALHGYSMTGATCEKLLVCCQLQTKTPFSVLCEYLLGNFSLF